MMKKVPLIFGICFLVACNFFNQEKSKGFDNLLEKYYQESLELYRINATFLGDHRYNDSLPDFLSPDFLAKQKCFLNFYIDRLNHFDDQRRL